MPDMGPGLGSSYISRETPGYKEPIGAVKPPQNNHINGAIGGETMNFVLQGGTNRQTGGVNRLEGMPTNSAGISVTEEKELDSNLTESSSSYSSYGVVFRDAENDPDLIDDVISGLNGSDIKPSRNKRLTSNWRNYVGPLVWRCKWVEMQIMKFKAQAQDYDREIAEYSEAKETPENKIMKRNNRRRDEEDPEEISSYYSNHNLFSYFENKKTAASVARRDGNLENQAGGVERTSNGTRKIWFREEVLSPGIKDRGDASEDSLWKIWGMQKQILEMRRRAHEVLRVNAARFCSSENLNFSVSSDTSSSSTDEKILAAASSSVSFGNDTKKVDMAAPGTANSRLRDVHVLDNMKSTNLPASGGSSSNTGNGILTYNRRNKTPPNQSSEIGNVPVSKTMDTTTTTGANCNKRKSTMRKAGSGKWNK